MDFDLQNARQSRYVYENLKWSHGQYEHFAQVGFLWTHNNSSVFDKRVDFQFSGNKLKSENGENGFG